MDLLPPFSSEEELSEAEKRIQKASIPEIVNKLEFCSNALVATPGLAGLLYLYDGQGNWGRSRYASLAQGPGFLFARREEKTKLATPRLPDEVYSAILTIGRLRQAEKSWETIAHSPPDTSGHDSSGCTEWFCDKSNCIASRRNLSKRAQRKESSR
ncbi:hypothetical protein BGAL_0175g00150 [Botrytis galanthina]|uniref:Uncharacterized protein n=1 Tax=Botrytis galanthina TaxID=278940 RepID=A0A4S8QX33_9HELO|nr:hypothetical protein BGAL_0175g00150 [Botrytis galanthina]